MASIPTVGAETSMRTSLSSWSNFFGQDFSQAPWNNSPNPVGFAEGELQDSWDAIFYNAKAALLTQLGAAAIFGDAVSYNPATGLVEGTKTLSQDAIDDLQAAAPTTSTADTQHYWEQVAQYIGVVKGFQNLTTGENTMMNTAIVTDRRKPENSLKKLNR